MTEHPKGYRVGSTTCGIKPSGVSDLMVMISDAPAAVAGVFTQSHFPGEPVNVSKEHLAASGGVARAIVCNSGISNVATGQAGYDNAKAMCQCVADELGCPVEQVLVASTGIIGQPLPIDKILTGIPQAIGSAGNSHQHWLDGASAIMTTDTKAKWAHLQQHGQTFSGMAKGAGMIAPNMATMLSFIASDAVATHETLQPLLRSAVQQTFNRISIDSDTSTSDMVLCLTQSRGDSSEATETNQLGESLHEICRDLTHQLLWDGEGVTRLFHVVVSGAATNEQADAVGRSVVDSPLVKCAVHGSDANWGRLVMAIGKAESPSSPVTPDTVSIGLSNPLEPTSQPVMIFQQGQPANPSPGQTVLDELMQQEEVAFHIHLGQGSTKAHWRGCDLSRDYITINADYTT